MNYQQMNLVWKILKYILLAFSIFMIYFAVIIIAIQSFNSTDSTTEFASFTFQNYAKMFGKGSLNDSILNTFKTSIIATLVATVIGTFIAVGAYYLPPKIKNRLLLLNNIPLLNADIVTGISMMLLFVKFMDLGFVTVLIAHITFSIPYVILNVMPKLRQVNRNTYEAALDLGATPMYAFYKVTWPDIRSGVFSGFMMAITMSLDDFSITYFTKGAGVNTLSTMLYTELRKGIKPELYALSTILFFAVLIILLLGNVHPGKKATTDKN